MLLALGYTTSLMFLLLAAALFATGGHWVWLVLLLSLINGTLTDEVIGNSRRLPGAYETFFNVLLFANLPLMAVLTILYVYKLGGGANASAADLSYLVGGALSLGMLYGVSATIVAHELIHRPPGSLGNLAGRWLLSFTFDVAFAVVHVHWHHRFVATESDTASARRGEGLYAFFIRSTVTGWRQAWRIETERLARQDASVIGWQNRIVTGWAMSLVWLGAAALLAGWRGVAAIVLAGGIGKFYLESVNYIQHYGLVRALERPVEARHAWDCARLFGALVLFNNPRHAEHHLFAATPFWRLRLSKGAPNLPFGYQTMMLIAMAPPLFRRVMGPHLESWDRQMASDEEKALVGPR